MKIIIPVAGIGTRLRPHTFSLPKPLLHVAGKPILAHILDPVTPLRPEEVIFVVGYKGDLIRKYVATNYSFRASFVQQDNLLGLGYALNLAMKEVDGGDIMVVLGDTIVDCDLAKMVAAGDNVLGVRRVDDPRRFGIAEIKNDRIVRLEEKPEEPRGNLAVIGLYYFREAKPLKKALEDHTRTGKTTRGEIQFTDALQAMIDDGTEMVPFEVEGWYDCGKKETMLETNRHLLANMKEVPRIEGSVLIPPVYVEPSVQVVNSILGPNVSVSEQSVIERSIISNSIVGSGATVRSAILKDSLVGNHAVVEGSVQILNVGGSSEVSSA